MKAWPRRPCWQSGRGISVGHCSRRDGKYLGKWCKRANIGGGISCALERPNEKKHLNIFELSVYTKSFEPWGSNGKTTHRVVVASIRILQKSKGTPDSSAAIEAPIDVQWDRRWSWLSLFQFQLRKHPGNRQPTPRRQQTINQKSLPSPVAPLEGSDRPGNRPGYRSGWSFLRFDPKHDQQCASSQLKNWSLSRSMLCAIYWYTMICDDIQWYAWDTDMLMTSDSSLFTENKHTSKNYMISWDATYYDQDVMAQVPFLRHWHQNTQSWCRRFLVAAVLDPRGPGHSGRNMITSCKI